MSDWKEKEWDEPGPDFGKVYYRPARPVTEIFRSRICQACEPEAQRRYTESDDKHMRVLEALRWELHQEHLKGGPS